MIVPRALAVATVFAALAACDTPPPAEPETPNAPSSAEVEAPPAAPAAPPAAPVPEISTADPEPEPEVALVAPVPAPVSQRPLSREQEAAMRPLFGTWAADLDNCQRGAIAISRTRFEGAENGCDIASLVDTGNWNFVATLSCVSQGQSVRERIGMVPLYAPTGEAIGLTYLDRDNQNVTVYRCD